MKCEMRFRKDTVGRVAQSTAWFALNLTGLFVLAVLSGCAVGVTHRYHDTIADLSVRPGAVTAVAITVRDSRTYVLDGDKPPSFVGLSRGGYGNPFDVSTESGAPLADDIARTICKSLEHGGFGCTVLTGSGATATDEAGLRTLAGDAARLFDAKRLLVLVLTEWKADTYQNTSLIYDATLTVYGTDGNLLARATIHGDDNLGGDVWNPPEHSRQVVPAAYKEKLERLLNNPDIAKALSGSA